MPLETPKASGALNLSGPPETAAISLSLVYFLKCQCLLTHSAYWLRAFLRLYWIFPDFPFESKLKTSSQLEWKRLQRKITELCTWLFGFRNVSPARAIAGGGKYLSRIFFQAFVICSLAHDVSRMAMNMNE